VKSLPEKAAPLLQAALDEVSGGEQQIGPAVD
jgi:hypothetical protein